MIEKWIIKFKNDDMFLVGSKFTFCGEDDVIYISSDINKSAKFDTESEADDYLNKIHNSLRNYLLISIYK